MQAYVDGETIICGIQEFNINDKASPQWNWFYGGEQYTVKPKPIERWIASFTDMKSCSFDSFPTKEKCDSAHEICANYKTAIKLVQE